MGVSRCQLAKFVGVWGSMRVCSLDWSSGYKRCIYHIVEIFNSPLISYTKEKRESLSVNSRQVMMFSVRQIFFFLIACLAANGNCFKSLSISSSIADHKLSVRVLTPTIFSPVMVASYSKIGPGFDLALQDIKLLYPSLDVVQELIYDSRISSCPEWEINVENLLAASFYRAVSETVSNHSVTAIVTAGSITQISYLSDLIYVLCSTSRSTYDWRQTETHLSIPVGLTQDSWRDRITVGICLFKFVRLNLWLFLPTFTCAFVNVESRANFTSFRLFPHWATLFCFLLIICCLQILNLKSACQWK